MMSKIPSFGFKSKLKVPAVLKARAPNAVKSGKDDSINSNLNPAPERPSSNSGYNIASYSSHGEICNSDGDAVKEEKDSDSSSKRSVSKENVQQTSQNLSKLADKLNASTNITASGVPSKIPPKPAFRRKGSSHIAKLNNGKDKERSGVTQLHGQTPYMKSPRVDSKPPLGATKNATDVQSRAKTKLSRTSGIPGGRGFVRKEGDKEVENGNETFSMPMKKQKGESGPSSEQSQRKTSSSANTTTATTAASTAVTFRRTSSGGLPAKSGLRPPSGNFTGNATGLPVPRTETKMKPPSNPVAGSTVSSKVGINDSKAVNAKGFARRNSGQDATIVKRSSKENLRTSNIAQPRQRTPSVELQTMAEKFKSYSGKRLPRPASITSEVDLRRTAMKPKDRRSLNPTNLRSVNSSSLQDISQKGSKGDSCTRGVLHRRSSSYDRFNKDSRNLRLSASSDTSKDDQTAGSPSQGLPSGQTFGLTKPRPRSSCKTLSSTTSEFGIHDSVNGEPYQSTPVSKTALDNVVLDGNGHPFENALNATLSGVFEDGCVPSGEDKKATQLHCRRVLNETFDGMGHNETFNNFPAKNHTFTTDACAVQPPAKSAVGRNDTFCKEPRCNATFEMGGCDVGADDAPLSGSSMGTDESINLTYHGGAHASETAKLSKLTNLIVDEVGSNGDAPSDENRSLSLASIDSCKVTPIEHGGAKDLEELIYGYQSDDFLLNETMPTLDGSFAIDVTNNCEAAVPSSPVKEEGMMPSASQEPYNKEQPHSHEKSHSQEQRNSTDEDACVVAEDHVQRPKSASRELKFEGVTNYEEVPRAEESENCVVLATSLINDSYDVVTIEEASGSDEKSEEKKNTTSEIIEDDELKAKQNPGDHGLGVIGSDQVEAASGPEQLSLDTEKAIVTDERLLVDTKMADEASKKDECSLSNAPDKATIPLSINKTEPEMSSENRPETGSETIPVTSAKEKDFSSLLSQTVEDLDITNETKTQANAESMIVNLLTPEDSNEAVKEILDSLSSSTNQMKMASRRRSLVRRNTSPYMTSSMPGSLPSGTIFRIPRETSITETSDGNVIMDEAAYRHCQNDVRMIKTNLLRLKRVLQEADIVSPFVKHPSQFSGSPPVTPTRATVLSRSFSDASSWLAKAKISDTPLVSEQRSQRPKSSLNKTDEDKVKDEIKDLKENQCRLEMELEEARHELESKNNTIKLLQTQLEHQEYMEQIELLLEEKIMLFEENQELKERIEELESESRCRSSSVKSIKEEYLKQSKSASKIRSEIVRGYYEDK